MKVRTTLTKSLHTVSAVSRLALYFSKTESATVGDSSASLVRAALDTLGVWSDWADTDATFAACVAAVNKARGGK